MILFRFYFSHTAHCLVNFDLHLLSTDDYELITHRPQPNRTEPNRTEQGTGTIRKSSVIVIFREPDMG